MKTSVFILIGAAWAALSSGALAQEGEAAASSAPLTVEQAVLPDAVVAYRGPEAFVIETDTGPVTIMAEIADTPQSRARGLMFRDSLGENEGMVLDHGVAQPSSIWMRNTLIGLDIVFIRADGRIAKIAANAQPRSERSIPSDIPVRAVLEIPAGRAAALGLRPGMTVQHAMFVSAAG
ncbi:DUF192 domain-containing protein [Woodsholea maritima]|uniref:DUF192 domain-containing protein n=1 Tax=Woodsholea maritima TaxID=240237 RepID=UPI000370DA1C|nr:DUF192 domain-containing protein [Woodsholea maritima]